MVKYAEKQCVGCALAGYYTALAIDKVLPVLHAGAGCAANASQLLGINNGSQQGVGFNENLLPCTNIVEQDIVFGGIEKLKNVIDKSLEYFDPDMIIALSGCIAGIIGDDLSEIENGFKDARVPVLMAEVPGFKGDNVFGHEQVLKAIINQYLKPAKTTEIDPLQVNVWGIIPYFDPFWSGNLDSIERLLIELGLKPNIIYGPGRGIENVNKISKSAFNLVVSPWWDLNTAKLLKERFGTPYFHYPVFPIGPTETNKFIYALADYAKLDKTKINKYIEHQEKRFYYYMERGVALQNEVHFLPRRFTVIANSNYALGSAKFLINDIGLIPNKQYIVDNVPEEYKEQLRKEYNNFDGGIKAEVEFTIDVGSAHKELLDEAERLKNMGIVLMKSSIIGSSWEDVLALNLNANLLEISAPVNDLIVLDRSYFGYDGALRFFEDLFGKCAGCRVS